MAKNSKKLDQDDSQERTTRSLEKFQQYWAGLDDRSRQVAEAIVRMTEDVGGRTAAAAIMGIGQTTLDNYRSGKTQPKYLEFELLATAAIAALSDATDQGEIERRLPFARTGPRPSTDLERKLDVPAHMVMIPQFEIRAAAGPGLVPASETPNSFFTVEREWLRRFLPSWAGSNAAIGILQGQGDSMEPTIADGDMIMVAADPPWDAVRRGGVFVVLHHDELRIKRLQHFPRSGDIDLISDNKRYTTERVDRDRVEFDLRILGQVFFAGGNLR